VQVLGGDHQVEVDSLQGAKERDVIRDLLDDHGREVDAQGVAHQLAAGLVVVDEQNTEGEDGLLLAAGDVHWNHQLSRTCNCSRLETRGRGWSLA